MTELRWGILSSAKIAVTKVIPAILRAPESELYAIASRTQSAAQSVADQFGVARVYDSYEALLSDPNVDAIYNPLPNHLHVDWSIKALEAGKHVLCEKPLGLNQADAERLVAAAAAHPHLKVMEAFMYRFHPQWQALKTKIDAGELGKIRAIHGHFSYNNRDAANIRNLKAMGGGALLDIGCYCISLSRWLFNSEPTRVIGQLQPFDNQEVDCLTSGILQFPEGLGTFTCATKLQPSQVIDVYGEAGRATLAVPFNPSLDTPAKLNLWIGDTHSVIDIEPLDQYQLMVSSFAQSVFNDTPVATPLSDAIANMRVVDAIFASIDTRSWTDLAD